MYLEFGMHCNGYDIITAKYGFYFECKRKMPEKENDGVTTRHVVDRDK